MELILHIGAHRTGSTALTRCFEDNRPALEGASVAALLPRALRRIRDFSAVPALSAAARPGVPQAEARLADVVQVLLRLADRARDAGIAQILLSEENLIGTMPGNLARQRFYDRARTRLSAYRCVLPPGFRRIGLGVRSYSSWWKSSYVHCLRYRDLPTFTRIAPALAGERRGWADLVEDVRYAFPGTEILVWRQEDLAGRVASTLAELVGRSDLWGAMTAVEARPNQSRGAAEVAEILALRANLAGQTEAGPAGPAPVPSEQMDFAPDAERMLADRYLADLARIERLDDVRLLAAGARTDCDGGVAPEGV